MLRRLVRIGAQSKALIGNKPALRFSPYTPRPLIFPASYRTDGDKGYSRRHDGGRDVQRTHHQPEADYAEGPELSDLDQPSPEDVKLGVSYRLPEDPTNYQEVIRDLKGALRKYLKSIMSRDVLEDTEFLKDMDQGMFDYLHNIVDELEADKFEKQKRDRENRPPYLIDSFVNYSKKDKDALVFVDAMIQLYRRFDATPKRPDPTSEEILALLEQKIQRIQGASTEEEKKKSKRSLRSMLQTFTTNLIDAETALPMELVYHMKENLRLRGVGGETIQSLVDRMQQVDDEYLAEYQKHFFNEKVTAITSDLEKSREKDAYKKKLDDKKEMEERVLDNLRRLYNDYKENEKDPAYAASTLNLLDVSYDDSKYIRPVDELDRGKLVVCDRYKGYDFGEWAENVDFAGWCDYENETKKLNLEDLGALKSLRESVKNRILNNNESLEGKSLTEIKSLMVDIRNQVYLVDVALATLSRDILNEEKKLQYDEIKARYPVLENYVDKNALNSFQKAKDSIEKEVFLHVLADSRDGSEVSELKKKRTEVVINFTNAHSTDINRYNSDVDKLNSELNDTRFDELRRLNLNASILNLKRFELYEKLKRLEKLYGRIGDKVSCAFLATRFMIELSKQPQFINQLISLSGDNTIADVSNINTIDEKDPQITRFMLALMKKRFFFVEVSDRPLNPFDPDFETTDRFQYTMKTKPDLKDDIVNYRRDEEWEASKKYDSAIPAEVGTERIPFKPYLFPLMDEDPNLAKMAGTEIISVPQPKLPVAGADPSGQAWGRGGRKTASALVKIKPGTGQLFVNGGLLPLMFPLYRCRDEILKPIVVSDRLGYYDVEIKVEGGGYHAQSVAIANALANALVAAEPSLRLVLRETGCLRRDPRMVERKKTGKAKARKGFQWSKR